MDEAASSSLCGCREALYLDCICGVGSSRVGVYSLAWLVYTCREKGHLRLQTAPKEGGRVEG